MHSAAEEVLNEIDTDESMFGIAGIDDFYTFSKKNKIALFNNNSKRN